MTDGDKYMKDFYNGDPLEWKEESTEVDEECVHCDGTGERAVSGFTDVNVSCSWCHGTGKMDKQEQLDLVRKDIEDQKRYRSYMYGSDDYIDGSDVPSDGFYESNINRNEDGQFTSSPSTSDDDDLREKQTHGLGWNTEQRANEVSSEENEVAQDLWQALGEGGLKSDYINGGIFKFDITYPDWVTDIEMDTNSIAWSELTPTDQQNVVDHFGGVDGMKEKLCDEGWDQYCEDEDGYESKAKELQHDEYEVDVDEYIETGEPVEKLPKDKRKYDSLNFDPSYEAETSDAEYEDWSQNKTDEDTTRNNLEKLQEETVEESFGDCGCKMTNKAKETWEVLTDSDKQLELRDMGVDEGYAYYPFEHLPKKIGEAFVDKFNTKENGDSLGWNKITALERADTLRNIGFTPRDSELVSNLEYQQLSESLKKDVNEALNYKVKAQESQVPKDNSQEKFENGLYSNMYDGYLERRGARVDSKKKAKILENNNFGLDISKVKGVEATVTKDIWDNIDDIIFRLTLLERAGYQEDLRTGYYSGKETWDKLAELSNNEVTGALSGVQISEQEIKETTNTGYFPDMFGGRVDRWGDKYEDNDPYVYESKASEVSIDDFKRIVDRHQNETLQFDDGKVIVDAFTANAVVQVYNALSEEQKQTFNDVVKTSYGVSKVANLVFKHSESKANEDMKWWECEDCKFFGKTEDETNKHELETGHTTYGAGMTSAFPTFLKSKKTKSKEHNYLGGVPAKLKNTQCPECGSYDSLYEHETHGDLQCEVCGGAFEWEQVAEFNNVEVSDLGESKASEVISDSDKQILSDWVSQNRDWTTIDDLPNEIHYPLVAPFGDDIDKRVEAEVEIIDYMESLAESKANEIKNYLGIELDSISQMIDKIRNGTIDNHHLSRFADYHGLPEGWTKEDIIDEIRVYEGMEDELDFEGREDGEISQIRSLLYGYESKATEDMESQQRGLSDSEEEELMEQTLEEWQTRYLPYESAGQDVSYNAFSSFAKSKNLTQSEIDYLWNEGGANPYSSGTEAQVMGTPITNNDKFGREWGFSIINHGYGAGSETPYEVGIFLHDEIHKKNDVKGWLNEEEALYYKAKFEVDPIDTFRSIGGQMDSIINPDFVEQTEDNWNLWESLQDSGEASLSDPDNKKYNMDTDFGFSYSDKDIEALDAETDIDLSVDKEATEENPNRDDDGQFTSDLPEEKNEDYGRDPYHGKVDVPFVEAKESKSKAEEALDKGASAEKIYSLVDDKGTDDDRSESEEEYLNNLYNKTNANKSTGFSDLQ